METASDGSSEFPASPGRELVKRQDLSVGDDEWADLRSLAAWVKRYEVLLGGLTLIVLQLAWKAQFLSHEYFRQDDFKVLDKAIGSQFSWSYLTYNGAGHMLIGPRAVAWVLARISLYGWGLDSALNLALVACASLAALRVLQTVFGNRRAILIPLLIYLICPLTFPTLGEWSSALEAVPLQLAIFMSLNAHVWYTRTGRARHLAAALFWTAFGLIFFEKALVLPLLLFAITSAFFAPGQSWLVGMKVTLRQLWRAWLGYGLLIVGYAAILGTSFKTSSELPAAPASLDGVVRFARTLLWVTFIPGASGGPWRWYPPGGSYAVAATPHPLAWLALAVAAVAIVVTIWYRPIAWRSWLIMLGWLVAADMAPVIIGRLDYLPIGILGLETRYLADAVPVLAICLGFAVLPVTGAPAAASATVAVRPESARSAGQWGPAANALLGVFIFGSAWSLLAYQIDTSGVRAASYIANASLALQSVPRGTLVAESSVPAAIVLGTFGAPVPASSVIGPLEQRTLAGKLRWIRSPSGTVRKQLLTFGADGRLHAAAVLGAGSGPRPGNRNCWPVSRNGQIVVGFLRVPPPDTKLLRVGYLWYSKVPTVVGITYGNSVYTLTLMPGLNSAFLKVSGQANNVSIDGPAGHGLCIGDVEAGVLGPSAVGPVIP